MLYIRFLIYFIGSCVCEFVNRKIKMYNVHIHSKYQMFELYCIFTIMFNLYSLSIFLMLPCRSRGLPIVNHMLLHHTLLLKGSTSSLAKPTWVKRKDSVSFHIHYCHDSFIKFTCMLRFVSSWYCVS